MSKTIILVDGGKGGVGKSMVASAIVEYLLDVGQQPLVVEADGSVPDVGKRYRDVTPTALAPLAVGEGTAEDRVLEVFGVLLEDPAELIVVNLPSGAGEVIDRRALLLAAAFKDVGAELVHVWVIGNDEAGASLAEASLQGGVAGVAARRIVVRNVHHGDPDKFPWMAHPARKAWLSVGTIETTLPRLPTPVRDRVTGGFRSSLAELNAIQRASLKLWLRDADQMAGVVVGNGNE